MPTITIRNLSETVYRALKERAAHNGRSMEIEVREILEAIVRPSQRIQLGSVLAEIGREVGLTDEDCRVFEEARRPIITPEKT